MTVTTFNLMRVCVAILKAQGPDGAWPTDCADRIYTPGDWPGQATQTPYIRARVQAEDKQSLGRGAPRFTVTGTIKFTAYADQAAQPDDSGATDVDTQLQGIARQLEAALINHPLLMRPGPVQQFPFAHSRDVYDASGNLHNGALEYLLGVEFYQDTDDFYAYPTDTFSQVFLDADLVNIFDPSGAYTSPVPDPDITDPPRTQGPDGRPEGGLLITLDGGELDFSEPDNSALIPIV